MIRAVIIPLLLSAFLAGRAVADDGSRTSETVAAVLRKPLPPEEIRHRVGDQYITIQGPTFTYAVNKANGAIASLEVRREEQVVVEFEEAADIVVGQYSLASKANVGNTEVVSHGTERVVLETRGVLKHPDGPRPDISYRLTSVFYNDGVAVSELTLLPKQDLTIREGIKYRVEAQGRFSRYLHKALNHHGLGAPHGPLPGATEAVAFKTPTSCLQVFSPQAALAAFTDCGAIPVAGDDLDTATIEVLRTDPNRVLTTLTQHLVRIGPNADPYVLRAGTEFTLRVGISIAPNRLPHARRRDLRMFIWIGDDKHPYPTDQEIEDAAHLGYTLFQMHRLGNPGEPRPPAKELDRVIKTVHDYGMLFLWTANADLMYACADGVEDLRASGKWDLWRGFNYGGRYTASMDAYCDLPATCLASPNGLAEYRLECIERMMDRHEVDGMYIDDNLAHGNCTLAKEHKHPRAPYDSLIELHEMNFRRRQLLRRKCPHAVLVDHCLPVILLFAAVAQSSLTHVRAADAPGLLVVHPDNPRYVMAKGDPTRKAVCLTGAHTWAEFQTYREETFDYDDWIGELAGWKQNLMRGWIWEDGYYGPLPYARVGDRYDLTRYNPAFFDSLKTRIRKAGGHGLYVSVMLFQGWSVLGEGRSRTPPPWPRHPFHRDNNINNINGDPNADGDGREIHTLQIPAVTRLQEAYVEHFIDELNDFDNIVWEIGNECNRDSAQWQYHMIDFVKRYEAKKTKQHLVWVNLSPPECFASKCHADIVSPSGSAVYFNAPPAADGTRVIVADSDHISPLRVTHEWAWKSFARGLNPVLMDCKYQGLTWWSGRGFQPQHPKWQQLRNALTVIRGYADRMNLGATVPQAASVDSPSSTRYCLYEDGKEYLVYQPERETPFTVELPAGSYRYEWINPVAGKTQAGIVESRGGRVRFAAPIPWPAGLYVTAASTPDE